MSTTNLNPEIAAGIKDGDLKVEFPGGFSGTTARVWPATEKGQQILGFAVAFKTFRKSAMVGV